MADRNEARRLAAEFDLDLDDLERDIGTARMLGLHYYITIEDEAGNLGTVHFLGEDGGSRHASPLELHLWHHLKQVLNSAMQHDAEHMLVRNWMCTAGQATPESPVLGDTALHDLRLRLIREETDELAEAYAAGDLVGVADACADLLYVVHGTNVAHGIDGHMVFLLVHENNCLKIERGHRDEGGKWIKPADHQPPDIAGEIVRQYRTTARRSGADGVACTCGMVNWRHPKDTPPFEWLTVLCTGERIKL